MGHLLIDNNLLLIGCLHLVDGQLIAREIHNGPRLKPNAQRILVQGGQVDKGHPIGGLVVELGGELVGSDCPAVVLYLHDVLELLDCEVDWSVEDYVGVLLVVFLERVDRVLEGRQLAFYREHAACNALHLLIHEMVIRAGFHTVPLIEEPDCTGCAV